MKYLVLLLLLAGCAQPKNNLPPPALDPKYFKRDKLYPYIYLKNSYLETPALAAYDLNTQTFPILPPAKSPYWQNVESFSNGDTLYIRIPTAFKNEGKILAYTNKDGGIFINDEEILVPPEEIIQYIKNYPRFFHYYDYEEWLYAYTNFAGIFFTEVTNVQQLQEHFQAVIENWREFLNYEKSLETKSKTMPKGYSPWEDAYNTFNNFYVPPEISLRTLLIIGAYQDLAHYFYISTELKKENIWETPEDLAYNILPLNDLRKFYHTALNLMWLSCLPLYHRDGPINFVQLYPAQTKDLGSRGLLNGWSHTIDSIIPKDKKSP